MTGGHTGRCGCGNVEYTVTGPLRDIYHCHCERCRRFSGHHVATSAAPTADITIVDNERSLRWYSPHPDVAYGFCSMCGSSLFWRDFSKRSPETSIMAGTLDDTEGLIVAAAWWTHDASSYHQLQPGIPDGETAQLARDAGSCEGRAGHLP